MNIDAGRGTHKPEPAWRPADPPNYPKSSPNGMECQLIDNDGMSKAQSSSLCIYILERYGYHSSFGCPFGLEISAD